MELRIQGKDDRLILSGILVDNDYRVEKCKIPRIDKSGKQTKTVDYGLRIEDARETNESRIYSARQADTES